ncbi:MAG: hypothetical protein KGJ97_09885 [Xanthomonadaceae bacterium]|jgi:hypothetical protein|nr:hypothetical protein [Xanthomonadaceae bacterium]MDE3073462.1 hypothetical protein [Pseudomonadota bacterium]
MRVTHWLVGCALCLAGIGSAAAVQLDASGLDGSMHTAAAADGGAHDDGNRSHGDMPAPAGDDPAHDTSTASGHRDGGDGGDRSVGTPPTPAHPPQPHLGWQSLLPGSIQ